MRKKAKSIATAFAICTGFLASPVFSATCATLLYETDPGFEQIKALAEKGNRDAQCTLGAFFRMRDEARAIEWYKKSAAQGQAQSQFELFSLLHDDFPDESLMWLQKAAEQDYVLSYSRHNTSFDSRFELGRLYERGGRLGRTSIQREKALYWYRKAMDAGYAPAKEAFERLQSGLLKGWPQKVAPVRKKAENGDPDSQYWMGILYAFDNPSQDYKAAREWLQKAADQGHATASVALSVLYEKGLGGKKDQVQAFAWHEKAVEQALSHKTKPSFPINFDVWLLLEKAQAGDVLAQSIHGFLYANNFGRRDLPVIAAFFYDLAGRQNSAVATAARDVIFKKLTDQQQHKVKMLVDVWRPYTALPDATGAWKDQDTIAERLRQAESGDAEMKYKIASDYEWGVGDFRLDKEQALVWYRKAAESGSVKAQKKLASFYASGKGLKRDDDEAMKWYRLAADQGDIDALSGLASLYRSGKGATFTQDDKKASELYRLAAEKGLASAQYSLGALYEFGHGVAADHAQALFWYEKAAAGGYDDAKRALSRLQKDSDAARQQQEKTKEEKLPETTAEISFLAHLKAAEEGDMEAQYRLGMSYQEGRKAGYAVDQDMTQAAFWYEKAAQQGHAGAQWILGQIYLAGVGGEENQEKGLEWVRKAADQGNGHAFFALGSYALNKTQETGHVEKARAFYQKAADLENANGQYALGVMYMGAQGIPLDLDKAVHWIGKAAQNGHADAQRMLGSVRELQRLKSTSPTAK